MEIQCTLMMAVHNKNADMKQAMNEIKEYFESKQMSTIETVEISPNTSVESFSAEDFIGEA